MVIKFASIVVPIAIIKIDAKLQQSTFNGKVM
jgi:hypothetical protein